MAILYIDQTRAQMCHMLWLPVSEAALCAAHDKFDKDATWQNVPRSIFRSDTKYPFHNPQF